MSEEERLRAALEEAQDALSRIYQKAGDRLWKSRNGEGAGHVCDFRHGLQAVKDVAKRALSRTGEALGKP